MNGEEVARQIRESKQYLPSGVQKVIMRGDGEFISWESVHASESNGYDFIFGNKRCTPDYKPEGWYRYGSYEYNEAFYQPMGWGKACRFVVMRIPKEAKGDRQLEIFEDDNYAYRNFVTNLKGKPHKVIAEYDGRADIENCIGEAQRAGLLAIPSKSFAANHVFFQLVMLAYNLWRWMNLAATRKEQSHAVPVQSTERQEACPIHILRLKMLFVAAKIIIHSDKTKVRYSIHDVRSSNIIGFMEYLDRKRKDKMKWKDAVSARFARRMA